MIAERVPKKAVEINRQSWVKGLDPHRAAELIHFSWAAHDNASLIRRVRRAYVRVAVFIPFVHIGSSADKEFLFHIASPQRGFARWPQPVQERVRIVGHRDRTSDCWD